MSKNNKPIKIYFCGDYEERIVEGKEMNPAENENLRRWKKNKKFIKQLSLHFMIATVSAVVLGLLLGGIWLQMLEANAVLHQVSPETKVDKLTYATKKQKGTLEAYPLYVVQGGVFMQKSSVEKFKKQLKDQTPLLVFQKNEKYYVLLNAYAKHTLEKSEIERQNQVRGVPVYVYASDLSEKEVMGNLTVLREQRKAVYEILKDIHAQKGYSESKFKRWQSIFSVNGYLSDKQYENFLNRMQQYLDLCIQSEGKAVQSSDFMEIFFIYYIWNESLEVVEI